MKNKISTYVILAFVLASFIIVQSAFAQKKDDDGKLIGKGLLYDKCGKCHSVDKPLRKNKSLKKWEKTVKRMQMNPPKSISDADVTEIAWYLSSKSLFETKCSACHKFDRAEGKNKKKSKWEATVKRMQQKKKGWFNDDEATQIIDYLFSAQ